MSPTVLTAAIVAAVALSALVVPVGVTALGIVAVLTAAATDAYLVRERPEIDRSLPHILSRGVSSPFEITARSARAAVRVRQPQVPDVAFEPQEGEGNLQGQVVPKRRGRHDIPGVSSVTRGPLGLGRWFHRATDAANVLVYPDLPAARRIALAVREGRFGDPGRLTRGPLGLGTAFESIRDYLPDDDIRQVNWRATARLGRPMSNQYRIEQDRDVVCVVDSGRLMAAPLGSDRTRLDAAIDASVAIALVADVVGDRCGAVAFDSSVRRSLRPRRKGGDAVVRSLYDLEATRVDSDYELAFQTIGGTKRSLVIVFTDLIDEAAARSLLAGVPVLVRRHVVAVVGATDPDLQDYVERPDDDRYGAATATVARNVLAARALVVGRLKAAGATVIEAPPDRLAAACVAAYLRAKGRARL